MIPSTTQSGSLLPIIVDVPLTLTRGVAFTSPLLLATIISGTLPSSIWVRLLTPGIRISSMLTEETALVR